MDKELMRKILLLFALLPVLAHGQILAPILTSGASAPLIDLGYKGSGDISNTNGANQVFLLTPITPASNFTVVSETILVGSISGSNQIRVGIYTSPSGGAANVVCQGTLLTYSTDEHSSWDTTPVSGCVLTGGVTYYLAYNTTDGGAHFNIQGTQTGYFVSQSCSGACTMTNVTGLTTQTNSFGYLSIYVTGHY